MNPSSMPATGGCLCGGVRFTIDALPAQISVCHCDMCRRWTGGPMMAIHPDKPIRLDKDDSLNWYRSSDWASRGFCSTCGASLFYRLAETPGDLIATAGALDHPSRVTGLKSEIFIDEKPEFYDFAGDRPRLTGAEAIAMFTQGKELSA